MEVVVGTGVVVVVVVVAAAYNSTSGNNSNSGSGSRRRCNYHYHCNRHNLWDESFGVESFEPRFLESVSSSAFASRHILKEQIRPSAVFGALH